MQSESLRAEYYRNLEAIEKAFPTYKLLTKEQMRRYLGVGNARTLKLFGISGKLTRESFAMRLTIGKEEQR